MPLAATGAHQEEDEQMYGAAATPMAQSLVRGQGGQPVPKEVPKVLGAAQVMACGRPVTPPESEEEEHLLVELQRLPDLQAVV